MTSVWQDCRFGFRMLSRNWRLAAVIVFTIGAAVATSTTALSVFSAALLRPLPLPEPERLYRIEPSNARGERIWISVPTLMDWQDRLRDVRFMGYSFFDFNVFGDEGPESVIAARVTAGFFETLRQGMALGRVFDADEYTVGGPRSVILTHSFWERRYGGDPSIIGRRISLTGPQFLADASGDYRVTGVLRPDFWLFARRTELEIILPLRSDPEQLANRRRPAIENILARLGPGTTPEHMRSGLAGVVRELAAKYGSAEPVSSVRASEAQTAQFEEFRPRLFLVLTSALLVFVLAGVNVAAMLIALAVGRHKEFAVRAALGAARFGMLRQALVEGLLLGAAGGAAGMVLGLAGTAVLRIVVPSRLSNRIPGEAAAITVDERVGAIVLGAVLLMSLVCGLVTFFTTGGAGVKSSLRNASRGTTEAPKYGKLRSAILAPQLALAVALVVTTSILLVSLVRLQSLDLGVRTDRLIGYWLNLDERRYPQASQRADYFDRVIERVRAMPEAESVGGIDHPFNQDWPKTRVMLLEQRADRDEQLPEVVARSVTPEYFQTVDIPILSGRVFVPGDTDGTLPVAVVSRTLADRLWPGRDPLGQQIRAGGSESSEPWLTVVGVAGDVRRAPQEPPAATLYRPVRQKTPPWLYLMIQARSETADLTASLEQAVWTEDPRQPIEGPYLVAEWVRDMTGALRFVVVVALSFSVLGILLALTGVYGLTADLSQRAIREIGIRKALGATTGAIIRLFMYRSAVPAVPALLIGGAAGIGVVRALASEVESVAFAELWVTPIVIAVFALLVVSATYVSSRRAAGADPALTMKVE